MKSVNARRTVRWTSAALLLILSIALTAAREARAYYDGPPPAMKAPIVAIGTVTASSIAVSWAPVNYANGYQITMANGTVYRTTATSFVIPNLAAGTQYVFTVAGRSDTNAGSYVGGSAQAFATTATASATPTPVPLRTWTQLYPGYALTNATIGTASFYGVIATSGQLMTWNVAGWVGEGPGTGLLQAAYGNDGDRWGITSTGAIYHRMIGTVSWSLIGGALKQISCGNRSNIWGVNSAGSIYRFDGLGWVQVAGTLASVSVGADGTVWGLGSNDAIFRWNGSGWTSVGGALHSIGVGSASNVWGVNAGGQVYKWNGTGWSMPAVPSGTFVAVSAAADGSAVLRRNDGTVWKW